MNKNATKTGHTPGPWRVKDRRDLPAWHGARVLNPESFHFEIHGDGFMPAAILADGTENRGTAEANAHLIAAAPTMREALEEIVAEADNGHLPDTGGVMLARTILERQEAP